MDASSTMFDNADEVLRAYDKNVITKDEARDILGLSEKEGDS